MPDRDDRAVRTRQRDHIPAEFLRAARQFRDRVLADDVQDCAAVEAILAPLRRRLARKSGLRPAMVIDTIRLWNETVPSGSRLDVAMTPGRKSLTISELRLVSCHAEKTAWGSSREPGVSVARIELRAADGRLVLDTRPLAAVCLHALARRYQRGGADETCITQDIGDIVAVGVTGDDAVPVRSGLWVGPVLVVRDDNDPGRRMIRMRDVRTYINHEMIPDGRPWRDLADMRSGRATRADI